MKKLATILITFLLIGCSAEEETQTDMITTPEFCRGMWTDNLKISAHKIEIQGNTITKGAETFNNDVSYEVKNDYQEVLILKSGDRLYLRYKENGEILIVDYFEKL